VYIGLVKLLFFLFIPSFFFCWARVGIGLPWANARFGTGFGALGHARVSGADLRGFP
jgi:hypothetical protein